MWRPWSEDDARTRPGGIVWRPWSEDDAGSRRRLQDRRGRPGRRAATCALTSRPFGVNVFSPSGSAADPRVVRLYARRLEAGADRIGVALGEPRFDDDYQEKLDVLEVERPAVVSFTFGCPTPEVVGRFHEVGAEVWVTVTDPDEAVTAVVAGTDALVVQGVEAGGHRARSSTLIGTKILVCSCCSRLVGARVDVPMIAAGGIITGRTVASVLVAGAAAAALGTAYMCCPGGGHLWAAPEGTHGAAAHGPDPRVLGAAGSRHDQSSTGRAHRGCAGRLSRNAPPHRSDPRSSP